MSYCSLEKCSVERTRWCREALVVLLPKSCRIFSMEVEMGREGEAIL